MNALVRAAAGPRLTSNKPGKDRKAGRIMFIVRVVWRNPDATLQLDSEHVAPTAISAIEHPEGDQSDVLRQEIPNTTVRTFRYSC